MQREGTPSIHSPWYNPPPWNTAPPPHHRIRPNNQQGGGFRTENSDSQFPENTSLSRGGGTKIFYAPHPNPRTMSFRGLHNGEGQMPPPLNNTPRSSAFPRGVLKGGGILQTPCEVSPSQMNVPRCSPPLTAILTHERSIYGEGHLYCVTGFHKAGAFGRPLGRVGF